ncbi:MAG: hypothetical protein ACRCSN_15790 [Dermatophilaceae bacterium]
MTPDADSRRDPRGRRPAAPNTNPPKRDQWPPWPDTRFVLVRNIGTKPCRGLLVEWRRNGYAWEALVVWYDDIAPYPTTRMDWITNSRLIPVPVDPNWTGPGTGGRDGSG